MQYNGKAFAVDKSKPTIIATDPSKQQLMGQRDHLSAQDVSRIKQIFNCP